MTLNATEEELGVGDTGRVLGGPSWPCYVLPKDICVETLGAGQLVPPAREE